MAHCLILGMTESGKTTLAKKLLRDFKKSGIKSIVFDPLNDPNWCSDEKYDDSDDFLESFWSNRRCAVFIDEAGESVGRYDMMMQKTATRGRHWGHSVHYLAQRATQLNRTVRDQCSHLFLFCSSKEDGKIHAQDWNDDALLRCNELKRGEFFHATRFDPARKYNIFEILEKESVDNEEE